MDGLSVDAVDPLAGYLALKNADLQDSVGMALMAKSLENQRLMAAEIARMLQVGTALDVTI